MIRGPIDLTPAIEYEIVETRKAIPLSENEGVYVRHLKTGEVKLVRGPNTFLLGEHESFWKKIMEPDVERLLTSQNQGYIPVSQDERGNNRYDRGNVAKKRDYTKAVTFKAPHNAAVQLFDYKSKQSRIVFGPELVLLEPYEDFTLIKLSGGAPKMEN